MPRKFFGLLTVALSALLLTGDVHAEKKKLDIKILFQGSNDNEKLEASKPDNGVITNQKAFDNLFAAWKPGEQKPVIDFGKDLVLVSTTVGSRLSLFASLDTETGDLQVGGLATRDLRPGFRYVIGVVSREGIKTVNRKDLPKD